MNDNYMSIYDVFSDENTYTESCPNCLMGEYELYEIPELCWNCYETLCQSSLI